MQRFRDAPADLKEAILQKHLESNPDAEKIVAALSSWPLTAREDQIPPDDDAWLNWLLMAGRGAGKTRTGAETVHMLTKLGYERIALIAPTAADARDVMVEGESGIMNTGDPSHRPIYQSSRRRVVWPNGAMAYLYSGEEPERLRGPQHDAAWCDELAAWTYDEATWDMMQFGLRLGDRPIAIVTTTPRPTRLVKRIRDSQYTRLSHATTFDNLDNLAPTFRAIIERYEGTRLGRQELLAELLDDNPDALWQRPVLDDLRVTHDQLPEMQRIVVAVDPPAESGDDSDECGIIVAGKGVDGHGYVIADLTVKGATPMKWAKKVVNAYLGFEANLIVAEVNQGGDMVRTIIHQVRSGVPVKKIRAKMGKVARAEPVSALYEQRRVHHVGTLSKLEDQMCDFTIDFDTKKAGYSPDRVDALVYALTALMVSPSEYTVRAV